MTKNPKVRKLKKLKRDYVSERKGYRARQYDILGDTMAIVLELRSDRRALRAFLKLSEKSSPKRNLEKPEKWLTSAAIAYVTTAKSESAIKGACKRARALDHLHDYHGVPVENIAAEIQARGGIEAVANLAAKENPRRPKAKIFGAKSKSESGYEDEVFDDLDDSADSKSLAVGDEEDAIVVNFRFGLRAKLKAVEPGRYVRLIAVRTQEDDWVGTALSVKKLTVLKR